MLDFLRRNATGWMARIMIGLLVISFLLWGIADYLNFTPRSAIAEVGGSQISVEEFQRLYQRTLSGISRESRQTYTPEQARAARIPERVLENLINAAALINESNRLALMVPDETVADAIRRDPSFLDEEGKFARDRFEAFLRKNNLSEAGFLDLRRKEILNLQIIGALASSIALPKTLVDQFHSYRSEKRVIAHFTLDVAKAITVPSLDETKLRETYDQRQGEFMTPQYRSLEALILGLDQVKGRVAVSDDEVAAFYKDNAESFDTLEKRRIQQIPFKDVAAAETAKTAIDGGKAFLDVAKEAGATVTDIELGVFTKKEVFDPIVAEAAFALEKDKVSAVVKGRFAPVLLRVADIEPGTKRTLDDVKGTIRDRLFKKKATPAFLDLHDQIDTLRIEGKTLKEIAETLGLKYLTVPATDKTNKNPEGTKAVDLPDAEGIIITNAAFEGAMGLENAPKELPDGGYVWVEPLSIKNSEAKSFDSVKGEVEKLAIAAEKERLLAELAGKIVERAKKGEVFEDLAKEFGATIETTAAITRTTSPQGLSRNGVARAFALPKGDVAASTSADNTSRTILKLMDIQPAAPPTKEEFEELAQAMLRDFQGEAVETYILAVRERQGVSIKEDLMRRAMGDTQEP